MGTPQSPLEDRRFAQLPCNIAERRLQPYVYETLIYDQETETALEARGRSPNLRGSALPGL